MNAVSTQDGHLSWASPYKPSVLTPATSNQCQHAVNIGVAQSGTTFLGVDMLRVCVDGAYCPRWLGGGGLVSREGLVKLTCRQKAQRIALRRTDFPAELPLLVVIVDGTLGAGRQSQRTRHMFKTHVSLPNVTNHAHASGLVVDGVVAGGPQHILMCGRRCGGRRVSARPDGCTATSRHCNLPSLSSWPPFAWDLHLPDRRTRTARILAQGHAWS